MLVLDKPWYSLITSIMLDKQSPFTEYDQSKFNPPLSAAVLNYDEREDLLKDLNIKK